MDGYARMTPTQARRQRAHRLAQCRRRARALGYTIEETPTGGFLLLGRGVFHDEAVEEGLPEISDWLDLQESKSVAAAPNENTDMRGIEVAFVGTLAADPEQRSTKAGRPWTSFRCAVSTGKDGETTWLRCATFSESAIQATAELKKGQSVYIEGSLRQAEYQDREGQTRVGLDVTASLVQRLGQIGERRPKKPAQPRSSVVAASQAPGHVTDARPADDAIPF